MLSLLEEVVLLALDERTGKLLPSQGFNTSYALAGAVFFDLALARKIDTDTQNVQLLDTKPTGSRALDFCLLEMARHQERRTVRAWLEELITHRDFLENAAHQSLIDAGILTHVQTKRMWILNVERFPMVDAKPLRHVKLRLAQAILSDEIPDTRDIMLVSLAEASGLLRFVLSDAELEQRKDRVKALCLLETISREVNLAIRDMDLQIKSAITTYL